MKCLGRKYFYQLMALLIGWGVFWLWAPGQLYAAGDYEITDFHSQIQVQQDTKLLITETIQTNFLVEKHGIFRTIPTVYTANGQTIRADLRVMSVSDENGKAYQYSTSRVAQSLQLKIGDPDTTLTGSQTYILVYEIGLVLLRYQDHDEVYWNITGSEWDVPVLKAAAVVKSAFAPITDTRCYTGLVGTSGSDCTTTFSADTAQFTANSTISPGSDFTVVVALNPDNQLRFPGPVAKFLTTIRNNIGYLIALLPLVIIAYIWHKRGRDQRYVSDQIYYQPEDQKTKTVPLFAREYLPTVYSPIKGLTPAQLGTLIDEKVDIRDVVAEIVELARLGFIKIEKVETKKLLGKKTDYRFTKLAKDSTMLPDYQQHLLDKLFAKATADSGTVQVMMSSLKNHFYTHLDKFKKLLYANMQTEKLFDGDPEKTRQKWWGIFFVLCLIAGGILFIDFQTTYNFFPFAALVIGFVPGIILANSLPRRTPTGYALYRQAVGLQWYIDKSKWREEISEKHLFLEEILPLAISLGVVAKLSQDMADLGQKPPQYLHGIAVHSFASDLGKFESTLGSTLSSTPSGKSSWSGGSGFSGGGGSGGGFGGGGGGSW